MRIFPDSIRTMHASKPMRIRHELWHFVRSAWGHPSFPDEGREILRSLGWDLPSGREPMASDGSLLLDNYSGEDFLFMHREMIAMTNNLLAEAGERPITRWREIPEPGSSDFPVPEPWVYSNPDLSPERNQQMTDFLVRAKSDEYFETVMQVRERFFRSPDNLARMSLGTLGNFLEMTIHNMMHMRWSENPGSYRPQINLADPTGGDPFWDDVRYDYLGDTYSSHVNPHFWYLHGWIDSLIDLWADVNDVEDIDWVGTWSGGPDLLELSSRSPSSGENLALLISRLNEIVSGLTFPKTLIEIASQR